ncbi:uncharacterized protein LOC122457179 [Dermochelys coriacea]|uniref:uncharacterized protein LOC122457179 n=1 Tax=Dermochelys coriacea TaxID=27794 RepID=UPI001CA88D25|nr:uncharacterized protein LOC122457179 [Dermochelys coriacea]
MAGVACSVGAARAAMSSVSFSEEGAWRARAAITPASSKANPSPFKSHKSTPDSWVLLPALGGGGVAHRGEVPAPQPTSGSGALRRRARGTRRWIFKAELCPPRTFRAPPHSLRCASPSRRARLSPDQHEAAPSHLRDKRPNQARPSIILLECQNLTPLAGARNASFILEDGHPPTQSYSQLVSFTSPLPPRTTALSRAGPGVHPREPRLKVLELPQASAAFAHASEVGFQTKQLHKSLGEGITTMTLRPDCPPVIASPAHFPSHSLHCRVVYRYLLVRSVLPARLKRPSLWKLDASCSSVQNSFRLSRGLF